MNTMAISTAHVIEGFGILAAIVVGLAATHDTHRARVRRARRRFDRAMRNVR